MYHLRRYIRACRTFSVASKCSEGKECLKSSRKLSTQVSTGGDNFRRAIMDVSSGAKPSLEYNAKSG
jgi:hypothetical protein